MTLEDTVKFEMAVWDRTSTVCKRLVQDML